MTFEIAVTILAVWRLTHLIAVESGPWDCIVRLREKLGDSMPGRLMDCQKCLSLWCAAIWFAPLPVRIILALSAGSILIGEIYGLWMRSNQSRG